ncbi:MAG: hypothetical protein SPH23_06500 [Prevotella sp.]|nr:hypothetical protein [Prevotellaceae bacterium]MDY5250496.1 hypothetical protein [Prevotella sp.]
MKSILLSILAMLTLMPAVSSAQTQTVKGPSLDIKKPVIGRMCKVTGNEVNIRKSASATAPKLMMTCYPETDECTVIWSNQKGWGSNSPLTAYQDQVFIILDETPEWYKVMAGNDYYKVPGYITKKFCQEIELSPVTPEMLNKYDSYGFDVSQKPGVLSGKYKGYAVINSAGFEREGFVVGRIVDGYFIAVPAPTDKLVTFEYTEKYQRLRIGKDANSIKFYYGKELAYCEDEYSQCLDFSKLTDIEMANILIYLGVKSGDTSNTGYIYANVNGELKLISSYDFDESSWQVERTDVAPEVLFEQKK